MLGLFFSVSVSAADAGADPGKVHKPCSGAPKCATKVFSYEAPHDAVWKAVHRAADVLPRAKQAEESGDYLRYEVRTRLGFVDDFEVLRDRVSRTLSFRSESRLGYFDFGVNRRRIRDFIEDLQFLLKIKQE